MINAIRAHLAEFGVVAPVGRRGIEELLHVIADPSDKRVPDVVRACLAALGSQLLSLKKQILDFDRMILAWHRSNQTSKRLNCIPGVGPLLATALVASVADPKAFRSGRNFSAWIGLVPKVEWGAGQARQHQQTGGSLSAKPVRSRRTRRHPLCQDPRHQVSALGRRIAGTAADQSRCYRACQQARPNGLGDDVYRRAIQLPTRGSNEIASSTTAWSRSIRRSGQPTWAIAFSNASF
jgi:Transposase IS116/IS110/IS902 family